MAKKEYDKTKMQPAVMSSICTGEKVAGFKNLENGTFSDVMAIRNDKDMKKFIKMYGIDENDIVKIY